MTRRKCDRPTFRCECGDHAWKVLTQGYVTLVAQDDEATLADCGWHANPNGSRTHVYAKGHWRGRTRLLHRVLLDPPSGMFADHANGNTLDNRRVNLRVCTREQNMQNKRSTRNGPRGVYFDRRDGRWRADIGGHRQGRRIRLGAFATEAEAAEAYRKAAQELYGEFAYGGAQNVDAPRDA